MAFRRTARPADRSDALALLDTPGCPACRSRDRAVARWLVTYENESRTDLAMRERLERSFGFCPPHTRALLDGSGASASWLARWLFADVARAGAKALHAVSAAGGTGTPTRQGGCPLCAFAAGTVKDAMSTLVGGLAFDDVARAFRAGDGPCVTHGAALLARADPPAARTVAEVVVDQLGKDSLTAFPVLTGSDPDVSRRRRLAAEFGSDSEPTELVRTDCCPLCFTVLRTERRYPHWLARAEGAVGKEMTLCPRHLADLDEVEQVVDHLSGLWRKDFQTFLGRATEGSHRQVRRAAAEVGRWIGCRACDLRDAAVGRTRQVLRLAADDPSYAEPIAHSHGVCLPHSLGAELPAPWRNVLRARVSWLAHELAEAERKSTQEARWEEPGPEQTAWKRAPGLLTGV